MTFGRMTRRAFWERLEAESLPHVFGEIGKMNTCTLHIYIYIILEYIRFHVI
jgi:hypothetical protein